jgi:hypothetical protein
MKAKLKTAGTQHSSNTSRKFVEPPTEIWLRTKLGCVTKLWLQAYAHGRWSVSSLCVVCTVDFQF